jgi:hypothetical protein
MSEVRGLVKQAPDEAFQKARETAHQIVQMTRDSNEKFHATRPGSKHLTTEYDYWTLEIQETNLLLRQMGYK